MTNKKIKINTDYYRQLAAKCNKNKGIKNEIDFLELKPGVNTIRIVPYKFDESDDRTGQFVPIYWHYNIGNKNFVSPITAGEEDPIYSQAIRLKQQAKQKEDYQLVNVLTPSVYFYTTVIDRSDDKPKVKYWRITENMMGQLSTIIEDIALEEGADIIDPIDGYDLKVTFTPKQDTVKKMFNEYEVRDKRKPSRLSDDEDEYKRLLDEQLNILEYFSNIIPSKEEIKGMYNMFIGDLDDLDEEEKDEKKSNKSSKIEDNKSVQDKIEEIKKRFPGNKKVTVESENDDQN